MWGNLFLWACGLLLARNGLEDGQQLLLLEEQQHRAVHIVAGRSGQRLDELRLGLGIGAAAILAIFLIANLATINEWLGKLFGILAPLFTGLVIAYLANPFFRFFERRLLIHLSFPRLRRILALVLTYLVLLAIIAGLILLIVPQLLGSIESFIENFQPSLENFIAL